MQLDVHVFESFSRGADRTFRTFNCSVYLNYSFSSFSPREISTATTSSAAKNRYA